jgi:hypothetical protein
VNDISILQIPSIAQAISPETGNNHPGTRKRGKYSKSSLPSLNERKVYRNLRDYDNRPAEVIGMETGFTKKTVLKLLRKLESKEAIAQDPLPNVWIEKLDTIQQTNTTPRKIERPNPQFRKRKLWGAEINLVNDLGVINRIPYYETWANRDREQLIRRYFAIGWNVAPARNKKPIFTKAKWAAKTPRAKLGFLLAHDDLDVGMWITKHLVFDFDDSPEMPDYDTLITKSPHGYHTYFWRTPETKMIYGLPRVGKDISINLQLQGYSPNQIPLYCRANIDTRTFGDFITLPPSHGYEWAKLRSPAHLPHYNPDLLEVWKHRWQWSDLLGQRIRPEGKFELPDVIPEGMRQELLFKLGRSLRAKGESFDAIASEIRLCNQQRCEPPIDDEKELERTINWVWVYRNRRTFKRQ